MEKMRIPVTYWNEVKTNGDLVNVLGVLKVDGDRVFVLEELK